MFQIKRIEEPTEDKLNEFAAQGYSIVCVIQERKFDPVGIEYFQVPVAYMQRYNTSLEQNERDFVDTMRNANDTFSPFTGEEVQQLIAIIDKLTR